MPSLPRDFREYANQPRPSVATQPAAMTMQNAGSEYYYSDEQVEWLIAMDRLKRRLKRHPRFDEVLREAKRLGYRRQP